MYKVTTLVTMILYILCGSCGSKGVYDIAMLKLYKDTTVNVPGPSSDSFVLFAKSLGCDISKT